MSGTDVFSPVDQDGPPLPCGCGDCTRDAAWIVRLDVGTPAERAMTACNRHIEAMATAYVDQLSLF